MNNYHLNILRFIKKNSEEYPDKIALIEGNHQVSYYELNKLSNAAAVSLKIKNLMPLDVVGIHLDNSINAVISFLGVLKAGGIVVFLNTKLKRIQLNHIIINAGIKILISENESNFKTYSLIVLKSDYFRIKKTAPEKYYSEEILDNDIALIIYTSGSTGMPKGVSLTHSNLFTSAEMVAGYLNNTCEDIILSILPFHFDYGLNQLLTVLKVAATLVIQESKLPSSIVDNLINKNITGLAGVPTFWIQLLDKWSDFTANHYPLLKYITNSGGKIPEKYLKSLQQVLPNTKIYLMYGLTEAFRSTYLNPELIDIKPDSIGKPLKGVKIAVINDKGEECCTDEVGELVHCGGVVFKCYWNDPEATEKIIKPWPLKDEFAGFPAVWSGDYVKKDKEGFLYFIGRKDNLIKRSGYRISPEEIESIIYRLPYIKEAVVVSFDDEILGEKIILFISLNNRGEGKKADILMFCRNEMPKYMIPSDIILMDNINKNINGKFDKVKLKDYYITILKNG